MKLLFVYNADSGMINTVKDIGHKLLSPQTYDCFLCSLTHGTFRENDEWKKYREKSSQEMEFLHRDEFEKKYNQEMEYPIVLEKDEELKIVISKEELGNFSTLGELIEAVDSLH